MKKKVRWQLFRIGNILQLACSVMLIAMVLFQSIRSLPKGDLFWIISLWLFILIILGAHAAVHIHILYRYYPDRLVPSPVIIIRTLLTILSWIAVVFLSVVFVIIFMDFNAWEKADLKLHLVYITLLTLTFVSIMGLILQSGLIRIIRQNYSNRLLESISRFGQDEQQRPGHRDT